MAPSLTFNTWEKRKSMTSLLSSHNRNDVSLCWNKNDQQQTVCIVSMLEYYRILPLCMYTKAMRMESAIVNLKKRLHNGM